MVESDSNAPKGRVLVVDDELGPRESLRFLLKQDYQVTCAASVDEGYALFQEHRPDLVILDIRMPGKSGIDGLRMIREADEQVSVVMLTGYGALETAQEALRLGANDYLKKPFDTQEILAAVDRFVNRTRVMRGEREASQRLREINEHLAKQLQDKEHLATVGQASAEFAHDLKNPLTVVIGYLSLLSSQMQSLREQVGDPVTDSMQYLDVIETNVKRCHELADSWREHSKADQQKAGPTNLNELLEELVDGVKPMAQSMGVKVIFEPSQVPLLATVVPSQLLRALHNVVANGLQALNGASGSDLHVITRQDVTMAVIEIRDNGPGMSPEVLARAEEAFFTTKPDGTGLGLHIARQVLESHQGSLEIVSEEGRGTRVSLLLPAMK